MHLLFVLLLSVSAAHALDIESVRLAEAWEALERGDAGAALEQAPPTVPEQIPTAAEAETRLLRGLALRELGRTEEAADALAGALALSAALEEPLRRRAAHALADLYRETGQTDIADLLLDLYP